MIVVFEVSVDPTIIKPRDFDYDEMCTLHGYLNEFCSKLDQGKFGYVSAEMFVNGEAWGPEK